MNEKFAPELLENQSEVVDCVLEQVNQMEQNIQRSKKSDFSIAIYRMEVRNSNDLYFTVKITRVVVCTVQLPIILHGRFCTKRLLFSV